LENEFALRANKLHYSDFPLEFQYKKFKNSFGLYISALSLKEVSDIINTFAFPNLNIFGVDHDWYDPELNAYDTLRDVALSQNVPFHAYDNENIVIAREHLPNLLDGFCHFNFHFYDSPYILEEIEYIQNNHYISNSDGQGSILEGINDSSIWIDSHDDCYFYIETKSQSLLETITAKAFDSLCRVTVESIFNEPIKITQKLIKQIFVENKPVTILQVPVLLNENVIWPIFFQDFPWSSNGDLSHVEGFEKPESYLVLDLKSGECTIENNDLIHENYRCSSKNKTVAGKSNFIIFTKD